MTALAENSDKKRLRRLSRWAIALAILELASLIRFFALFTENSNWSTALSDGSTSAVVLNFCIIAVVAKVLALFFLPWLARWGKLAGFMAEVTAVLGFIFAAIFVLLGGLFVLFYPFLFFDDGALDPSAKLRRWDGLIISAFLIAGCAFASALCINKVVPLLDESGEAHSAETSTHQQHT